jgi:hypothetical protein
MFIIYHTVDLGLVWADTWARFRKWFPDRPERSVGGIQCQYYRLNAKIPKVDAEGLLDFGPFTKDELKDDKVVSKQPYPLEGGVRYRVWEQKCRQDRQIPLSERFPEEVAYGGHPWILPEHRNNEKTKMVGKLSPHFFTNFSTQWKADRDKTAGRRSRQRAAYLRGYM